MQALTANFNRLALYLAYRAGLLTWGQLPLTTQVACIKASTSPWYVAPKHATWAASTMARTGGVYLTGNYPTVNASVGPLANTGVGVRHAG
jgi:hypothetical protein